MREDMILICRMHKDELEHARKIAEYKRRSCIYPAEIILYLLTIIALALLFAGVGMLAYGAELAQAGLLIVPALWWCGTVLWIGERVEEES